MIFEGQKVKLDYILKVDGKIEETTRDKQPLEFSYKQEGNKKIVPGLAACLKDLEEGDRKTIIVDPREGYGLAKQEEFKAIPKEIIPKGKETKVGTKIRVRKKDNSVSEATIVEETDDTVVLNLNHPLAGKKLEYEVEVLEVS